jgi:hypothetical protein
VRAGNSEDLNDSTDSGRFLRIFNCVNVCQRLCAYLYAFGHTGLVVHKIKFKWFGAGHLDRLRLLAQHCSLFWSQHFGLLTDGGGIGDDTLMSCCMADLVHPKLPKFLSVP